MARFYPFFYNLIIVTGEIMKQNHEETKYNQTSTKKLLSPKAGALSVLSYSPKSPPSNSLRNSGVITLTFKIKAGARPLADFNCNLFRGR